MLKEDKKEQNRENLENIKKKILDELSAKLEKAKEESEKVEEKSKDEEEDSSDEDKKKFKVPVKNGDSEVSTASIRPSSEVSSGSAPVLERIAGEQSGSEIIPRTRVQTTPTRNPNANNESEGFSYSSSSENSNEPKYSGGSSREMYKSPERTNVENLGRESNSFRETTQEVSFQQDSRAQRSNSSERAWEAERVNEVELGRRNPLDNEVKADVKYEERKEYKIK